MEVLLTAISFSKSHPSLDTLSFASLDNYMRLLNLLMVLYTTSQFVLLLKELLVILYYLQQFSGCILKSCIQKKSLIMKKSSVREQIKDSSESLRESNSLRKTLVLGNFGLTYQLKVSIRNSLGWALVEDIPDVRQIGNINNVAEHIIRIIRDPVIRELILVEHERFGDQLKVKIENGYKQSIKLDIDLKKVNNYLSGQGNFEEIIRSLANQLAPLITYDDLLSNQQTDAINTNILESLLARQEELRIQINRERQTARERQVLRWLLGRSYVFNDSLYRLSELYARNNYTFDRRRGLALHRGRQQRALPLIQQIEQPLFGEIQEGPAPAEEDNLAGQGDPPFNVIQNYLGLAGNWSPSTGWRDIACPDSFL